MRPAFKFLPALVLAAGLALPVSAETPSAETVVARVNGVEITLGHMIIAHATLPEQYQQLPADVLFEGILEQLIQQSALSQQQPDTVPAHIALALENERRSLLAGEEIESVMQGAATDEAIQAAYDAAYPGGEGGEEYSAAHILVETEDEAQAIKAEIDGGADFAETAREKSTGPSGPNGGDLGWFGSGRMVPEFEAAVIALEPGQVSDPVQTQFGWHVIKLNETRRLAAPDLAQVREELASQVQQEAVEAHVDALTEAATVERPELEGFSPEMLRDLDLVRN